MGRGGKGKAEIRGGKGRWPDQGWGQDCRPQCAGSCDVVDGRYGSVPERWRPLIAATTDSGAINGLILGVVNGVSELEKQLPRAAEVRAITGGSLKKITRIERK